MADEKRIDLLKFARDAEKTARGIRDAMTHLDQNSIAEIETMRYCGAILSLASSTLCELNEKLHPVFSLNTINGILREWGAKEIEDA